MSHLILGVLLSVSAAHSALADAASSFPVACKSDFEKLCPGLEFGKGLVKCVKQHRKELSDPCRQEIAARFSGNSGGKSAAMQACKPDYQKFCKHAKHGNGAVIECLEDHSDEISSSCKDALKGRSS